MLRRIISTTIILLFSIGLFSQTITIENCSTPYKSCPIEIECEELLACGFATQITNTSRVIYSEEYFVYTNGTATTGSRNITATRTGAGSWTITLSPAHPDGTNYHISTTTEEEGNLRDTPDITVVQGTKTATGFNIQITTGDNGGTADVLVDAPFTIGIDAPVTVITNSTIN